MQFIFLAFFSLSTYPVHLTSILEVVLYSRLAFAGTSHNGTAVGRKIKNKSDFPYLYFVLKVFHIVLDDKYDSI